MPRTKKTPTSQSLAARATKGPNGTPKSSAPSVAPSLEERVAVPVITIDADAIHTPEERAAARAATLGLRGVSPLEVRVAALEKVVTRLALAVADFIGERGEQAKRLWEENHLYELTEALNETTREEAFEEWEAENLARADERRSGR